MSGLAVPNSLHFPALINGDPLICARCAENGRTCCYSIPGDEDSITPISELEIRNMSLAAPWVVKEKVVAESPNSPRFLHYIHRLFPADEEAVRRAFPADGRHYRLATEPDGRCPLLGEDGCLVPRQGRPLFCRLYPFWMTGSEAQVFANPECQAQVDSETTLELCQVLHADLPHIRRLYLLLRRAWGLDRGSRG